jgi:hypothetical protein
MLTTLRKDLFVMAAFDAAMFASTFVCVLLQKAVYRGWITWTRSGWILQHVHLHVDIP